MAFDSELLDIAQAAALLQVSEASLRRWTNRGRLPCLRIGGRRERRFRQADLMAFLEPDASALPAGHLCAFYASDLGRTRQAAHRKNQHHHHSEGGRLTLKPRANGAAAESLKKSFMRTASYTPTPTTRSAVIWRLGTFGLCKPSPKA